MTAALELYAATAAPRRAGHHADSHLHPPYSLEETGLPFTFLTDLAVKILFHGGQLKLWELAERIKLSAAVLEPLLAFLRSERLIEVASRGAAEANIAYQLTDAGRARADAAIKKSHYAGPAPVTLAAYVAQVKQQSVANVRITQQAIRAAFDGVVLRETLQDQFGAALNSGRAMLLFGPAGSGKTFIAEHLATVLSGRVNVPHAILVDGDVIQVFDPLVHRPAQGSAQVAGLDRWQASDERWVLCHRPVVMTGGELTLSMLDLQFDHHTRFYVAPPQVKASNGLFIIDDLGRQLVSPRDLMNRWIVPLDRRVDHYALHTGTKFCLPFDVTVIFSSNLQPADLADDAFLRRLGYKIHVGEVSRDDYRRIFIQACERAEVVYSEAAFDALVAHHAAEQKPLLACIPYDVVSKLRDRADYLGAPAETGEEALAWAWRNYFAASEQERPE